METLWQDLRYAARSLMNKPGYTLVIVLTLAFGIGSVSAVFSFFNAVLLRPLPYEQSERLAQLQSTESEKAGAYFSHPDFTDLRDQSQSFERITAARSGGWTLTGDGDAERLPSARVSAEFFSMLGIKPALGRVFSPEEDRPGAERVVMLHHKVWQRRFGGDARILGQTIRLHGRTHTIIGVMPPGPFYPVIEWHELWTPLTVANESEAREDRRRWLGVIARLKPGVTPEQAQSELSAIHHQLAQEFPNTHNNYGVALRPLREVVVGRAQTALLILLGVVGFVLLIACANVANLLLARATAREKDMAIRAALGAGRVRLARQMLIESVLLALAGAACGLALAYGGLQLLAGLNPGDLPRVTEIRLDGRAMAFTFALALLTGAVFGLVPALAGSRPALGAMLKDAGRGTSGGRLRLRRALIVAEVALALVLLAGAGLMLKSFIKLTQVDPGFRVAQVLTVEIAVPSTRYKEARERAAIYQRILERLETLPGVASAGAINMLPLRGVGSSFVFIEGQPLPEPGQEQLASQRVVTPDYFRALGIPLLAGRTFTAQEAWQASDAIIINQAMARRFWPNQDPIGKRMKHDRHGEWQTVIGVVGDVRQRSLGVEARPETYMPPGFSTGNVRMTYALHTQSDPASLVGAIRAQVSAVEPNVALANVMTMERVVEAATAQPRLWSALIGLFAIVALTLASIGIYGVVAYTVSQRKQEVGIRMALGAKAGDVIWLIVGGGMKPVLLGVAIGLIAALALTRLMNTMLFGVTATDPMTFAGVSLLLTAVALVANLVPARRAIKTDPMTALRGD